MPVTLTYPGVYVEEIPSGVRTIVGVATSVAAFVGSAVRGPVKDPTTIFSFGEFEKTFGGLAAAHPMSYAVQDFYLNGGGEAVIVRAVATVADATGAIATRATIMADWLPLEATSEGEWGNTLKVRVEHPKSTDEKIANAIARNLNPSLATVLTKDDLFHLVVWDKSTGTIERFDNLTVLESSRRVDRILKTQSKLIRVKEGNDGKIIVELGKPKVDAVTGSLGPPVVVAVDPKPATNKPPAVSADVVLPKTPFTDPEVANVWYSATEESGKGKDGSPLASEDDYGKESAGTLDSNGKEVGGTGFYALEKTDIFNLLVLAPPTIGGDTPKEVWEKAATYCKKRRALLLVDPPAAWNSMENARDGLSDFFGAGAEGAPYSSLYFPFLNRKDKFGLPQSFVPSGAVAGVIARTDAQRGIWKAPAGLEAGVVGADSLSVNLTADQHGQLNPLGINCLRVLPGAGRVVYGARTLAGNDLLASEWKYVPVRRLALYVEETLCRGTQWVVFEPNADPLWAQIRANVGAFLHTLFRQGAFDGGSPQDAYYVRCDNKTTTPDDQNRGVVNIEVGFKPLKPAEFVVIKIQQIADLPA